MYSHNKIPMYTYCMYTYVYACVLRVNNGFALLLCEMLPSRIPFNLLNNRQYMNAIHMKTQVIQKLETNDDANIQTQS